MAGRGNLVLIERWDINFPDDPARVLSTKFGYNTTGSMIFTGDGLWHRTDFTYTDSFSDNQNHNTFAYPTTTTDPDSFASTIKYDYYLGIVKSKRVTNASGTVVSTIGLDPWGGETNRSSNEAFQPRKFTTYGRDSIGRDDAMLRRYNRWWARFEQPDPYGGSYDLTNPQSFNRYSYVQNDPVNFVDPTGLLPCEPGNYSAECGYGGFGGWGGGFDMNDHSSLINLSGRGKYPRE